MSEIADPTIHPPLRLGGRALPVIGRARIYLCGITPYDTTHLGHAATFVWGDLVVRLLRHLGVEAELCRNVTDVDDVLTSAARRAGSPYDRFAAVQQFYFDRDMTSLGVRRPALEPRAHNHIRPVIDLARALLDAGRAYETGRAVYLHGGDVPARAGVDRETALGLLREYGDDPADPAKRDPYDAVVWQPSGAGEPAWPSPWGAGRPGWHAECAAMVLTNFGPAIDLHGGGADLRFPHHAYEAAMAEAATGVTPFARSWMHVGTVLVDGAKMAKSAGNLVFVTELVDTYPAAAVRLLLLDRPWADEWNYTPDAASAAAARLERLYGAAGKPDGSERAEREAVRALLDDLDVPQALDIVEEAGGQPARSVLAILGLG